MRPATDNYSADLFGNSTTTTPQKQGLQLDEVPFPTLTKRRFARPTHISRIPRQTNIAAAHFGAECMGKPLTPQGEEVAAVLNARKADGSLAHTEVVVIIPRRGTKTTAIYAELIGRCATIPGYQVLVTAQDGTRAREILRYTIMADLEAAGFLRRGLASFRQGNGTEAIEWFNGSMIKAIPPVPGAFRSKAADVILIDEAGEIEADLGGSLIAAALPLMDTRPNAQLIVAGTPPETGEAGFLWDELQEALDPKVKTTGVLAYMLRPNESAAIVHEDGTMELDAKVIRRVHPGIGTVTTLATIRARFDKLVSKGRLAEFEREYGCRFTSDVTDGAIDYGKWKVCTGGDVLPERPSRLGLAYDVEPDGSFAALVAAWRDEDGIAHLELLAYDPGSDWLAARARAAVRHHRVPIAHDSIGVNLDVSQVLARLRTKTKPQQLRHMQAAEARLVREVETRTLRHYEQPDLTEAVKASAWRPIGDTGRLIGRKASSGPVCPIVAAAVALWQYDQIAKKPGAASATITTGVA